MIVVDREGNIVTQGEQQNKVLKRLYGTLLGRCILKILVNRHITNVGGWYMSTKRSTKRIPPFIKENNIDMSMYEERPFTSYNDFFTRKIKPGKRPFDNSEDTLIAPADSKLSYYDIDENTILTIKDTPYTLSEVLEDSTLAKQFNGGVCLIFRLTVDDYHRYSFIDDGEVVSQKRIAGKFHTVNPIANAYYPIYKTNSREYSVLRTSNFETIIQMEVGALMVGKIVNHKVKTFVRGQEKGMFEFGGSTVVLFFKKGMVEVDADIIHNSTKNRETVVSLGETIGKKARSVNHD